MRDNQIKFQNLLRELFQFDCGDPDFGIYRIINYKRAVIERFIKEELPKAIAEQLERGALAEQSQAAQALELFRDDYLLSYMLKWGTRHSETLLNIEKLQSSFSYKLHIHRDGETRERTVDLPETFNYLLGLDVQTRRVYDDEGRHYLVYRGALRNSRTVADIWRETKDWAEEDYRRDRDFVKEQKVAKGGDEICTNGDSFDRWAPALDGLFKERMFAGVEA